MASTVSKLPNSSQRLSQAVNWLKFLATGAHGSIGVQRYAVMAAIKNSNRNPANPRYANLIAAHEEAVAALDKLILAVDTYNATTAPRKLTPSLKEES